MFFVIYLEYILVIYINRALHIWAEGEHRMRRDKLSTYVEILKVLAHRGPLKFTHIMYKANINNSALREYLDFMTTQGLVEIRTVGKKRVIFAITQRGITVLKYFRELKQVLPIIEEAEAQQAIEANKETNGVEDRYP